mmetsp:Transcript_13207/g.41692  ORF Transcript_13207/g.41692 Transcript_13207/m.41692 type:complete len:86 (+) Transcript_13207:138-395(+)
MHEEQARMVKEMRPEDMPGAVGLAGPTLPTPVRVAYVLLVIAGVFGGGLWALRRMTRERSQRDLSARSARKLAKAADRLDKRKQG